MARKGARRGQGGAPPSEEGWGTHVHGTPSIAGAHPLDPASGASSGLPAAEAQPGQGRTWLILLVSFAVQLLVVLAVGNTGVVNRTLRYRADHNDTLGAFATLPSVYSWRLIPPSRDLAHVYAASLFGLLALFVVAALLTLALVRGPITFWRAFVAVWLSVIVATLAAGMVRRGVLSDFGRYDETGGKAVGVLFQGGGFEVVAGLITGALAALAAAIVAVATRRPAQAVVPLAAPEQAPYVEPPPPPPWHGDDVRPAQARPQSDLSLRKPQPEQAHETTRFAAVPPTDVGAAGATTRLRRDNLEPYGPPTVVGRDERPPIERPVNEQPPIERPVNEQPPIESPAERVAEGRADDSAAPAAEPGVDQRASDSPAPQRPQPNPAGGGDQRTQAMPAFPRPPDDEDLGHHPQDD